MGAGKVVLQTAGRGLPIEPCDIEWTGETGSVALSARALCIGSTAIQATDLFSALVALRLRLEQCGRLLLCNAARRDAYPSQMLLDMGGGRKVYLLTHGRPTTKQDLRDVLGAATLDEVATVEEQRRGYEDWLRSLA